MAAITATIPMARPALAPAVMPVGVESGMLEGVEEGEIVGVGVVSEVDASVCEASRTWELEVSRVELGTIDSGSPERAVFDVFAFAVEVTLGAVVDLGCVGFGVGVDEASRISDVAWSGWWVE